MAFPCIFLLAGLNLKEKKIFFKGSLLLHYLIFPIVKNVSIFFILEDNLSSLLNFCVLDHVFSLKHDIWKKCMCYNALHPRT